MHVGPLEVTAPKRNLAGIARIWVGLGGICGERRLGCRRHWITGSHDGSHDRVNRILVAVAVQKRKVLSKRSMKRWGCVWMLKLKPTNFASLMK